MKTIFISLLVFSSLTGSQDLKTFNAQTQDDQEYFEYEDYDKAGNPIGELYFLPGCSWYCGGSVTDIMASSELASSKSSTYAATNTHDFDKNTAWIEGATDYGIGESIEYCFDYSEMEDYKNTLGITHMLLANGYKKSKEAWQNNSRVKQLKMYIDNAPYAILNLEDSFSIQKIALGEIMFKGNQVTKIKFEITQVYPGDKYQDTAISLLMFEGVGVH